MARRTPPGHVRVPRATFDGSRGSAAFPGGERVWGGLPVGGYAPAPMEASATLADRARHAARTAGPLSLIVLALGVAGAVLLVVAELSTVVTVDVLTTGTCEEIADPEVRDACDVSGFEQHGGALVLLGLAAIVMAIGAARGASRPAAFALIAIAAVVIAIAVLRDLPQTDETGLVGLRYEEARAGADSGLYLELIGAGLCAAAGAVGLIRPARPPADAPT